MGPLSSSAAWSMRCAARSRCRRAWSSATRACRQRGIESRLGIHLGDVVEESDGDLMGDGVNIAARLEGIAEPGGICLSEDAYRQVKGRPRSRGRRSGQDPTQEHRRADKGLCAAGRLPVQVQPPTAVQAAAPKKRSALAPLAAAVAALLILIGGGAWWVLPAQAQCRARVTASIEDTCCEKIRGCSYRGRGASCPMSAIPR